MTVSSVASRSYLTDTSRHYSDKGDLVVVSELEYVKQKRCEVTLEWVQSYLKDRTYPLCATESEKRLIRKRSKNFSLSHDDVLLYVGGKNEDARVVLFTEEDRTKAFSECHASKSGGHQGRDRTEDKLRHYYWPHMHLDIRHWVTECDSCQRTNHSIKAPHLPLQPIPITGLWNLWGVDLIGPLTLTPRGNRYIIVATDYFSKWPEAAPLQNKEATTVAHFMYSLYCRFGASDIITDQGREFINEVKDNITKAQNSQIATDLKRKGKIDIKSHVSVGDKVLVRNRRQESRKGGKLTRKYLGPFTVKTISDKGQVGLINNEGKNLKTKQSIRNIKKYIKSKSCSPTLHGKCTESITSPPEQLLPITPNPPEQLLPVTTIPPEQLLPVTTSLPEQLLPVTTSPPEQLLPEISSYAAQGKNVLETAIDDGSIPKKSDEKKQLYPATDFYDVVTSHSASKENGHKVLMNNIRNFDLELRRNVPGDGNCLFAAVCDQLLRIHRRKRHIILRREVVDFMTSNPYTFDSDRKRIKCLSSFVYTKLSEENGYSKHNLKQIFQAPELKQKNQSDCGIFVCKIGECVAENLPLKFTTDSSELRSWLAKWLVQSPHVTYFNHKAVQDMMLTAMLATSDVTTALQKVLDQQLVSMCERVQSDLPYPIKCEEVHKVNPVEPLPERCFYENHAKKLKLWKAGKIPPYVNNDMKITLKDIVQICSEKEVEAVQHFLFGIAIDEGFKGPQANTLAWDVLYPELMITLLQRMNHSPETSYEQSAIHYTKHLMS
eukprot:Em0023g876a